MARRGSPQCVLITGPPGIGKTRLVREFRTAVDAAGFRALTGRCYEGVSLPFLPFRDHVLPALGPDVELSLGELVEFEAQTSPPMALMLTIARRVLEMSVGAPLVVLLDDVHWADPSSLALVRHLVFRMTDPPADAQFVLLATGRDEVVLETLRREHYCAVMELGGLDALESAQLARAVGSEDVSPGAVHTATGGNPFLIEATATAGYRKAEPPAALVDLVDARVAALDGETREVLQLAALLGPRLSRELLLQVGGWTDARVDQALDTAISAGVLTADPLRFAHPLLRSRCAREITGRRRRELHARIAEALRGLHDAEPVDIARDLVLAQEFAPPAQVSDTALDAAYRAMKLCAWAEAADFFEAAIAAQVRGRLDVDAREQSYLHLLAGRCRRFALQPDAAVRQFDAAAERSRGTGDVAGETNALLERLRCELLIGPVDPAMADEVRLLVDRVGDELPLLAAEGLVDISQTQWMDGRVPEARATVARALEIAEANGLHDAAERALVSRSVTEWLTLDLEAALASLRAAEPHGRLAEDATRVIGPAYRIPVTLLWLGRLDEAERAAVEAERIAEHVTIYEYGLALAARVGLAILRGNLPAADDHAERALLIQRLSGYQWAAGLMLPGLAAAHLRRGDEARARAALDAWEETADDLAQVLLARMRDLIDVQTERRGREVLRDLTGVPREPFLGVQDWAVVAVEVARRLGEPDTAARPVALLEASLDRGMHVSSALVALLPRVIADGHALLGKVDRARAGYADAINFADRVGAVEEGALARLGLATLLASDQRDHAIVLHRRARADMERLGLAPALADAHALAVRLGLESSVPADAAEPVVHTSTILFIDVVESTRLTEELGDRAYRTQQRALDERLRVAVGAHGGRPIPGVNLGDGIVALFDSVLDAAAAAPRAIEAAARSGLQIHVGLHHGELLEENDQVYGASVNLAARICSVSGPDEILVSEQVRQILPASTAPRVGFVDRGEHTLKGVARPQRLFALVSMH
jgi:class 3 adenylate cyclase